MSRFVVIDGHSQIYRALYSKTSPAMTDGNGNRTGGVFAFFRIFDSLLQTLKPDYLLVALDGPRHELVRRQQFAGYKGSRIQTPSELTWQAGKIVHILKTLKVPTITIKGWEADDVIATVVDICASPDVEVIIVTRDKDIQQVLRPGVVIYEPMTGDWIDDKIAAKKWGVPIDKIIEVQCLMGDPTDDIPGVPGVGIVGALKLIKEYGTAREVWNNRKSLSAKLQANLDKFDVSLGYRLVEMRRDLKISFDSQDLEWDGYDGRVKRQTFRAMGAATG